MGQVDKRQEVNNSLKILKKSINVNLNLDEKRKELLKKKVGRLEREFIVAKSQEQLHLIEEKIEKLSGETNKNYSKAVNEAKEGLSLCVHDLGIPQEKGEYALEYLKDAVLYLYEIRLMSGERYMNAECCKKEFIEFFKNI